MLVVFLENWVPAREHCWTSRFSRNTRVRLMLRRKGTGGDSDRGGRGAMGGGGEEEARHGLKNLNPHSDPEREAVRPPRNPTPNSQLLTPTAPPSALPPAGGHSHHRRHKTKPLFDYFVFACHSAGRVFVSVSIVLTALFTVLLNFYT
jgi:hypothetical protein